MSRLKASTILFSSPMAWLEKLFINLMHTCQVAGVIVCYRESWVVISGLAALSSFSTQSYAFLSLWPMKSMWSHWESVCPGRSAGGTHHMEKISDGLPWGVITQWGCLTATIEIHSFVHGFGPRGKYRTHSTFPLLL